MPFICEEELPFCCSCKIFNRRRNQNFYQDRMKQKDKRFKLSRKKQAYSGKVEPLVAANYTVLLQVIEDAKTGSLYPLGRHRMLRLPDFALAIQGGF